MPVPMLVWTTVQKGPTRISSRSARRAFHAASRITSMNTSAELSWFSMPVLYLTRRHTGGDKPRPYGGEPETRGRG